MKRFVVNTLGCKVNQCESAALTTQLVSAGFVTTGAGQNADVIVINTCTVTGKAAMQSRQAIRQAIRQHPGARIVVTGCYAQTDPKEIQAIEGVNLVVGHADKVNIASILNQKSIASQDPMLIHQAISGHHHFDALPSLVPENRTRAFLKIQDGCDAFCTYCIVPHARGRSRSMPTRDVLQHLNHLAS